MFIHLENIRHKKILTFCVPCILHTHHIAPTNAHKTHKLLECEVPKNVKRGFKITFYILYILKFLCLCISVGDI